MTGGRICPNCFKKGSFHGESCTACGYVGTLGRSPRVLPEGRILQKKYYIGRVLGMGGFGITYLAEDMQMHQVYAVKEYYPQEWAIRGEDGMGILPCGWAVEKFYVHGLEIYVNEARILRGLRSDSTIVDVVDFFQENNTAYIVMEYVRGENLASCMKRKKAPFSLERADYVIRKVAASLASIHSFGLLHRDVSPDNIMLTGAGQVKLIDFGATRQFVTDETTDMSVLIKPGFAPMEQYSRSGRQGPWTDVYALAATYYFILSGKKPPSAVDRCAGIEVPALGEVRKDVPAALEKVIQQAMEIDYSKRIYNMEIFLEELEAAGRRGMGGEPRVLMRLKNQIKKWRFSPDRSIRIGRSPKECDICLEGSEFSRIHCDIYFDRKRQLFRVTDYSTNGTYTRSGLIGKGKTADLRAGDEFYLVSGDNQFVLEVK